MKTLHYNVEIAEKNADFFEALMHELNFVKRYERTNVTDSDATASINKHIELQRNDMTDIREVMERIEKQRKKK